MSNRTHSQSIIDENFILEASVDNTRNLSLLLKAIHFRDVSVINYFKLYLSTCNVF